MRHFSDMLPASAPRPNRRWSSAAPGRRRVAVVGLLTTLSLGAAAVAVADPAASFSISDDESVRGQVVTFTAADSCVTPVTCTWSGDGGLTGSGRQIEHSYTALGSHLVTLTVDDPTEGSGEPQVLTRSVQVVNRAPVVSFDHVAAGLAVDFTARASDADGDPLTYAWDYGDGGSSTESAPTHRYAAAGTYRVTLSVSDSHQTSVHSASVTIAALNSQPTAAFTVATDGLTARLDATTSGDPDGDALDYTWSFGDGTQASGASVSHSFPTSGTYAVALTVADGRGGADTATRQVLVNRPPVAVISVSAPRPVIGRSVTFASASTDPDGDALRLAWDLDGRLDFSGGTAPTVTRSFATAGTHSVRLRVVDDHGAVVTATATVEVVNVAPTVSVVASPPSVLTGEPVTLSAQGEDPDGGTLDFAWDLDGDGFDDGSGPSIGPLAFELPETRLVRVRATDDEGQAIVSELGLRIGNRPPTADFDWTPKTVERGRPVTFASRATDPEGLELAEQSWDLDGDGDYDDAFGPTASTTFRSSATHEVGLRVVDAHGGDATVRIPIVLGNRPPAASFTVAPERPVAGDTVELTSTSSDPDGSTLEHAWDLDGDGDFDDARGEAARLRVERAGAAAVGLRVVDDEGGVDISRRDIDVLARGVKPAPVVERPAARVLTPFPSVRVAGRLTRRGASLRLVTVSAPKGARVSWSCSSRRCRASRRVVADRGLRIRTLERHFRAGTVIEVRVTRRRFVGKYTRIAILRNRAPARRDLCLPPGSRRPVACAA